jgi:hypothetical protein
MASDAQMTAPIGEQKVVHLQDEENGDAGIDAVSIGKGDILQLEHTDPVLNAKMHLVNNAIGMFEVTTRG